MPASIAQKARFHRIHEEEWGEDRGSWPPAAGDIEAMASRVPNKAAFYEQASEIIETGGMEAPDFIYDFETFRGSRCPG